MSRTPRTTAVEKQKRLAEIKKWLIDEVPSSTISERIEKKYGLSKRQGDRYVAEASKYWLNQVDEDFTVKLNKRIDSLKNDIQNLSAKEKKSAKGIRTILAIKKEISRLEGLYPVKKVQHSGDKDNPVVVNSTSFKSEQDEEDFKEFVTKKYNFKT
ncbi:hypothetical protein [Epilithonimonas caeni]|uniref:hypothetical protein n=1 Tax=Epilithonimonas caeni TaxID=365343 RepID=UPI00055374F6|nr:hypothetical protein [Epilithonimonas caeni]